jgi:transposase
MRNALTRWIERKLIERFEDPSHVCELCGDEDDRSVHAPLSTGEVVCWHCAERAGEYKVPLEMEWRVTRPE